MSKLAKQYWINIKGEKQISCYKAMISKEVLRKSNIDPEEDIKIYATEDKIIIEKVEKEPVAKK